MKLRIKVVEMPPISAMKAEVICKEKRSILFLCNSKSKNTFKGIIYTPDVIQSRLRKFWEELHQSCEVFGVTSMNE